MSWASNDEYRVPQMNGRAPKSCATGSQVSVTQNPSPNSRTERIDSRNSTTPIAPTRTRTSAANAPVPTLNPRSLPERAMKRITVP
jgi:hypothetical protein